MVEANKRMRLLALDGGGIRGLSSLMILDELMSKIDHSNPPKPCEVFDIIGGTSTGGLIAIMLGRLRMSVDKAINAYVEMSAAIFEKKAHRINVQGKIQARYDSAELKRAIQKIIEDEGLDKDALLRDDSSNSCKVFVCATSQEHKGTVCLRTYQSPRALAGLSKSVKIWEACRATSAASTFFDKVAIGIHGEEFLDGGTGANNPIWELWNEAQTFEVDPHQQLDEKVQCIVSIGTGVPSLKPFSGNMWNIHSTLVDLASETEETAGRFMRNKAHLYHDGRYFRFNVAHGLEDIGLDETAKCKELAAVTRRYMDGHDIFRRMQECSQKLRVNQKVFGLSKQYKMPFTLHGCPCFDNFVDRPDDMEKLEQQFRKQPRHRRRVVVLHGLGGIGKTQLAIEFARRHRESYTAVFWLDGSSKDSLERSIVECASRVPEIQNKIKKRQNGTKNQVKWKRNAAPCEGSQENLTVQHLVDWLSKEANKDWLLIFDNVDHDYYGKTRHSDAYELTRYFPADHGSILITSRLSNLSQYGESQRLDIVNDEVAKAIIEKRSQQKFDHEDMQNLLDLLHGIPLALAHAGAYLGAVAVSITKYVQLFRLKWDELVDMSEKYDFPLLDYNRRVGTTWNISYTAIREANRGAADLLLLWSCLHNEGMSFSLLREFTPSHSDAHASYGTTYCSHDTGAEAIQELASSETQFYEAIRTLRKYSIIDVSESHQEYSIHSVVHRWARYMQDDIQKATFAWVVPHILLSNNTESGIRRMNITHHQHILHIVHYIRWLSSTLVYNPRDIFPNLKTISQTVRDITRLMFAVSDLLNWFGYTADIQTLISAIAKIGTRSINDEDPLHCFNLEKPCSMRPPTLEALLALNMQCSSDAAATDVYKRYLFRKPMARLEVRSMGSPTPGIDHNFIQQVLQDAYEPLNQLHKTIQIGLIRSLQGRLSEAKAIFIDGIETSTRLYGKSCKTAEVATVIATALQKAGEYNEAQKMLKLSLQCLLEGFGPEHIRTTKKIEEIGKFYLSYFCCKSNFCKNGRAGIFTYYIHRLAILGYEKIGGPGHKFTESASQVCKIMEGSIIAFEQEVKHFFGSNSQERFTMGLDGLLDALSCDLDNER